ncbi:MAG: response regulator transcription factor [Nitrospirota bacterium]
MALKLAIGCHSYLLGEGLKKLLKDEESIDIIGIFDEGIDLKDIIKLNPDVILADFNIFRGFPEDFAINNRLKILLISDRSWLSAADKQIPELISRGVVGILPPSADSALLKKAISAVYSGELWIDRKTVKVILSSRGSFEKRVNLTRKEREIVALICQGYRNKEIAQKLSISEQTVKSHCNRIYKKVGVPDRLQLALYTYKIWPDYI